MSIQYAGGTNANAVFTGDTKTNLITGITTNMFTAGWTVVSGYGTNDVKMQSVATPQGNQIRVRVWDGGGTCVRVQLRNTTETINQSDSCYLLPATAKSFRIIANKYQFCVNSPTSTNSRDSLLCSAMFIPSHLVAVGLTTSAFIIGDGGSDSDASNSRGSLRRSLNGRGFAGASPCQGFTLLGSVGVEYNNMAADPAQTYFGLPAFVTPQAAILHGITGFRWHDDSAMLVEPLFGWGSPTIDSEHKIRGIVWDAAVATESYPMDIATTFDSHNWINITANNGGYLSTPSSMKGSLFLVTP